MTENMAFLRRMIDTVLANHRAAAQRRVDQYLEAIGLIERSGGE